MMTKIFRNGWIREGLMVLAIGCGLIGSAVSAQSTAPSTAPAAPPSTAPADPGPAQPSKNKGWISGTVHDADGAPAVGLEIRAEKNEPRSMGGAGAAPGDSGQRIWKTTTDENGHFTLKELDVKDYTLVAGNNDIGWIYMEVPAEAGKETKLGQLKLTKI
jgi:hypothetical protein